MAQAHKYNLELEEMRNKVGWDDVLAGFIGVGQKVGEGAAYAYGMKSFGNKGA